MSAGVPEPLAVAAATEVIDQAWSELQRGTYVQRKLSVIPDRLPDLSLEEAQRRSAFARSLLTRIEELSTHALPHDVALTLRLVRFRAHQWSQEEDWYWHVIDPLGIGVYGMFLPTAYCGGWFLSQVHSQLACAPLSTSDDTDRYLALVSDYARVIDQFAARTAGQAERGMLMPELQVYQARELLQRLKEGLQSAIGVAPERVRGLRGAKFIRELNSAVVIRVEAALNRALELLSETYLQRAPEAVGLSQYPGGAHLYGELVKLHTTLDITPEQVHSSGLTRMANIETQMRAIRSGLGLKGGHLDFLAHLEQSSRWRADSVSGLTAFFQRYLDRFNARFDQYFDAAPCASFRAAPLPASLEEAMTYGYYDSPALLQPEGRYLFNTRNLSQQPLFFVGALAYHELVPGHHLQVALQQENATLHPFRRHSLVTAYMEGWAEYAASLAGESGCYELPEERYGRLVMEALLTCRLVVDTGMNALGWPLERARDYMRQHTAMTDTEVRSESVRYSCDIPAQGLAYKFGDTAISGLRDRMRAIMGARFNIKEFHTAILSAGAVPLPDLEWHVTQVLGNAV